MQKDNKVKINNIKSSESFNSRVYTSKIEDKKGINEESLFTSSKLTKLYKQTIANNFVNSKLEAIRKFAKGDNE